MDGRTKWNPLRTAPTHRPACKRTVGCLLTLATVLGCGDVLGPALPAGSVPLEPVPSEYVGWWELTERCSGLSGDVQQVDWYVLPEATTIPGSDGAVARWYSRGNRIVFARGRERDGRIVRHEMLHALLRSGRHPYAPFVADCGGVVDCAGSCAAENGGRKADDLNAQIVDPAVLRVSGDLEPGQVSLGSRTRGCMTLVVSATNMSPMPVRARLPSVIVRNQSFGWQIDQLRSAAVTQTDSLLPFAAGETRRHTFDCVYVGSSGLSEGLAPGNFVIVPQFADLQATPIPFAVVE